MNQLLHQDSATPANGQQVITCVAFIHKDIEGMPHVMLAKRSLEKKFLPGVLELPGGHIDFGETLHEGLARELDEELGIAVSIGMPFAAFTYVNEIKGSHSIEVIFFAKLKDESKTITLNPHDHSEIVWLSSKTIYEAENVNGKDDPELAHIKYGLQILEGSHLHVGD